MSTPDQESPRYTFTNDGVAVVIAVVGGGFAALWWLWAESLFDHALLVVLLFAVAIGLECLARRKNSVFRQFFANAIRSEKGK